MRKYYLIISQEGNSYVVTKFSGYMYWVTTRYGFPIDNENNPHAFNATGHPTIKNYLANLKGSIVHESYSLKELEEKYKLLTL